MNAVRDESDAAPPHASAAPPTTRSRPAGRRSGTVIVLGQTLPDFLEGRPDVLLVDPEGLVQIPEEPGDGVTVTMHLAAASTKTLEVVQRLLDAGIGITPLHRLARDRYRMASLQGRIQPLRARGLWARIASRAVDLVVATLGSVFLALIVPLVALALWFDDGGPPFFTQERVGRDGRRFRIVKFRTMRTDAEALGAQWATSDDERVTRVGAFLRRYRIDELPQFVNVLLGQMSLIGPRPERPEFVPLLAQAIPSYDVRHSIRPGMTGWGTVNVGYGNTMRAKYLTHQYDMFHLAHRSIWFDIEILLRTARLVLFAPASIDHHMS